MILYRTCTGCTAVVKCTVFATGPNSAARMFQNSRIREFPQVDCAIAHASRIAQLRNAHCAMYAVIGQQAPRLGMVPVPRCPPREHAFGPSGGLPRSALVAQGPLRCRRASSRPPRRGGGVSGAERQGVYPDSVHEMPLLLRCRVRRP